MLPLLHRFVPASALALALAGCAPARAPQRSATAAGPYEVPGAAAAEDQGPPGPIPVLAGDPARGSAAAPVTIVEFADFQCPFCQRAAGTLTQLFKEYGPAKIRVVWKSYPLPFHPDARVAAEASMAILEQGGAEGFWRYHDAVFGAERGLGRDLFVEAVGTAGFSRDEVLRIVRGRSPGQRVDADAKLGRDLGVTGTPAFFINGVLVHGAQPIEKFRTVIDAQLQAARAAAEAGTPPGRIYAQLAAKNFVPPDAEADEDPPDLTVYRVPVGASPARGPAGAKVTIVEFADFECPFCSRAEGPLAKVAEKYGDKVRFVWKHLPLSFHKHAEPAAELAAEAFAEKGAAGFWKAHDLLMAQNGKIEDADLETIAKAAGLDPVKTMASLAQHKHRAAIEEDAELADDVDAGGTPTFFVNGRKLIGAQPFSVLEALIDQQLALADAALARGVAPAALYEALQANAKSTPLETATVPAPGPASPSRGPAGAKIVVQMWSDFECPFCKRVEPTLAQLEAAFPGQIRVAWHNHPLSFHPHAMAAAEAAAEAFAQKGAAGFWKMHDLILENQGGEGQERAALERYAAEAGLDLARFRAALDTRKHRAAIVADGKIAEDAGLAGTPGFMINGYRVSGAQPLVRFKKVVRRALAEAKPSSPVAPPPPPP